VKERSMMNELLSNDVDKEEKKRVRASACSRFHLQWKQLYFRLFLIHAVDHKDSNSR